MNDRYLYRAKHIHVLPCNEHLDGTWVIGYLSGEHYISNEDGEHLIDPETICQCTGLPDKKGKLIWENDKCVVKKPCVLAYGTIKYLDGCFCFVEDKTGNILRLCDVRTNGFEIEVESNIFDNPELLE